ncbi:hypothetical protein GCM10027258_80000 [Amycolatopsis stemonae]
MTDQPASEEPASAMIPRRVLILDFVAPSAYAEDGASPCSSRWPTSTLPPILGPGAITKTTMTARLPFVTR